MCSIYFGFAIADGMFSQQAKVNISRQPLTLRKARTLIQSAIPMLNPFHTATIEAMNTRFGINAEIPESPPRISLKPGDRVVVMSTRGLPRLTDRREYTNVEISNATFVFGLWTVL